MCEMEGKRKKLLFIAVFSCEENGPINTER